jgi:hypothetical protein
MRNPTFPRRCFSIVLACLIPLAAFVIPADLRCEQVPVGARLGALHGFLLLRDADGKIIATGDQVYMATGNKVHSRLTFHFLDGSVDDEEAIFSQGRTFQLIRDHHVQKGPSFPKPLDLTIDVPKHEVTWIEDSKSGAQTKHKHMELPFDLVNGMVSMAVQNFPRGAGQMRVSYLVIESGLVIDSGPRVVQFVITPDGSDKVFIGPQSSEASRFNIHVDVGGVAGVLAAVFGKQPPDLKMWVLGPTVPVFLKMTGALYGGGPVWTMELAAPSWTEAGRATGK